MKFSEIKSAIVSLAENDQSIDDASMTGWIAQGINRINISLGSNIPTTGDDNSEPLFDQRFHESLVLFSVSKYRASDASYADANYFQQQFEDMLKVMQRDMELLPSTKKDYNHQQITIDDNTILSYKLTMPSGSYYDDVTVYQNDNEIDKKFYSISFQYKTITFTGVTLTIGDRITIRFENHSDLNNAPYQWWEGMGW